jgi:hypothetical protein
VTVADVPPPQAEQSNYQLGHRANMWAIKTLLVGSAGWTIVGSCGYVGGAWASGMDGVDRWPDAVAVRWTETVGGYFSWIVLRNTAINASGQGYQICIACNAGVTQTHFMTLVDSWGGGFTGGATTARPTASDEQVLLNKEEYACTNSAVIVAPTTVGVNCLWTTDHTATRVCMTMHMGAVHYLNYVWCFELAAVAGRRAWWDKPYIAQVAGPYYRSMPADSYNGGQTDTLTRMVTRVADYKVRVVNTTETTGYVTWETHEHGALGQLTYAQTVDGNGDWIATRVGVSALEAIAGWLGRREDLWYIPESMATGEYLPTATFDFFVFGDLLLPNDGNAVPID